MGYFDTEEGVNQYFEMAKGHDGRDLIEKLPEYLPAGSSVLELGMGPGSDLELLSKHYRVTGSDSSRLFVDRYQKMNAAADVVVLDAVSHDIERSLDCLFSNKDLHHLQREDLERSVPSQAEIRHDEGVLSHSFWPGDKFESISGLHFQFYLETGLEEIFKSHFDVVLMERYEEMEPGDSIFLVARKR